MTRLQEIEMVFKSAMRELTVEEIQFLLTQAQSAERMRAAFQEILKHHA